MGGLLSVIVPVYNVENMLDRCIRSIVNQTYRELEIILIDDGSTDGSRAICQNWCRQDKRIVLSQEKRNEGVSQARNLGVGMSHGKYLAFVDSDDFLELDAYEKMIETMEREHSDMAICNFWNYIEDKNQKTKAYYFNDCTKTDILEDLLLEQLSASVCCKVIKREIMICDGEVRIVFPKDRRYEDTVVSFKQAIAAQKVSVLSEALYYYVQSSKTITALPTRQDALDIQLNMDELKQLLDGNVQDEISACYYCSSYIYALQLLYRTTDASKKDRSILLQKIKEYRKNLTLKGISRARKKQKLVICKLGLTPVVVNILEKCRRLGLV